MSADTFTSQRRYGYWLWASVPVAVILDIGIAGIAAFWWCGLGYCLNDPGDLPGTLAWLAVAGLVMFLAVALPPWIPGWRRPVIAAAAGLVAAGLAGLYAFQVI